MTSVQDSSETLKTNAATEEESKYITINFLLLALFIESLFGPNHHLWK